MLDFIVHMVFAIAIFAIAIKVTYWLLYEHTDTIAPPPYQELVEEPQAVWPFPTGRKP